ncbi:hypothetical protein PHET_02245 [Paragonimus heterotremus]|uniref:Uncharacterized protein n=1 Tax=Paragonimus heterotremus TaxID=100268 RepID=A0A8J4TK65_9TREM|nr:hypothetical protein PHET_02245 [Paragonimus heterotremus]
MKGVKLPLDYSVLFKRADVSISEKCQAYSKSKYQLTCDPDDWRWATTYTLHINSVSWSDRGDWFCVYAANLTKQHLVVYAPAELKKMGVTNWDFKSSSQQQQPPSSVGREANDVGVGQNLPNSMAAFFDNGPSGSLLAQHVGLGTRTNPYDLRPGLGLQLTCETTCGYPDGNISWLLLNKVQRECTACLSVCYSCQSSNCICMQQRFSFIAIYLRTSSKPGTTTTGPNQIDSFMCNRSASTAEMTTTKSTLNVNCIQLGLIGLNEVQCAVTGRQYSNHTPTRHVYVLCPDQFELEEQRLRTVAGRARVHRRGERPLELTSGEVVGIAVGAAIALILTFIGCVILRNSRKDSPLPFTGHFLGQRV